jgi:hypothetical protein
LQLSQVLGITFGVLCIALLVRFSQSLKPDPWAVGLLAGLFVAADPGLAAWATAGLETTMCAFLIALAAVCYVRWMQTGRGFAAVPVVFALAALTRPDGALLFLVTMAHLVWHERRRHGRWFTRSVWTCALVFGAIYAPYYIWRYQYYGFPLPNTAYVKVGSGLDQFQRGVSYLGSYLVGTWTLLLLVPVGLLALRRRRETWVDYCLLLLGVHWSYVIYVGGDGLAFYRFAAYSAPVFFLLAQQGIQYAYDGVRASPSRRRITIPLGASVVVLLALMVQPTVGATLMPERARWREPQSELSFPGLGSDHSYRWFDNYFVDRLAVAARWLEAHSPKDAVVASTPAGSISFHMDRTVIDMLGLNDVHIAHSDGAFRNAPGRGRAGHEKGDGKYVLSRKPDYILMGNVAVLPFPITAERMAQKLVLKSEHEIWQDPAFHRDYELVTTETGAGALFRYFTFYRRRTTAAAPDSDDAVGQP